MQSPQAVQASKRSLLVQGGRSAAGSAATWARRKLRRENDGAVAIGGPQPGGPGGPKTSCHLHTRKPKPPTTPTAIAGQITTARLRQARSFPLMVPGRLPEGVLSGPYETEKTEWRANM